jgi:addiction module HigA family antidote
VSAITSGVRGVTADTALRLAQALGTTPQFWMNLQQSYDLRTVQQDREVATELRRIRKVV